MKRLLTVLALTSTLAFGLACSGLSEIAEVAGNMEIKQGKDAVHPADFPLAKPSSGELLMSMKTKVDGQTITTLTYEKVADPKQEMQGYKSALEGKGFNAVDDGDTLLLTKDKENIAVTLQSGNLTLVHTKPE